MKTPALRIGNSYLLFSVVYFAFAWVLSQDNPYTRNNVADKLFYQLHDLFFWAKAYIYFVLSVIVTSALGAILSYRKSSVHYKVFKNLFFISVISFTLLILISNM